MQNEPQLLSAIRAGLSQQNRLLKFDTPLGPDVLLPQRAVGHEQLGRGYQYTVDLLSLSSDIELKELIAQPVTLSIRQTDRKYLPVHGYVHSVKKLGSDGQFSAYQLTFAAWLEFLKFRSDARIWQDVMPDDILADVFDAHPQARGNFRFELTRPLQSRSYCTQYETDWQFVMRIMEDEGWYGYHEQKADGSGHVLVITNAVCYLKALPKEEIAFHRAGARDEVDKILRWGGTRTLFSGRLATKTFNYKSPRYHNETAVNAMPGHGTVQSHLEAYEYTGAYTYADQDRGDKLSYVRVEEWESRAKRFHGLSGLRHLPVGYWFSLVGHPDHAKDSAVDRQFVVIAVDWAIENNLPLSNNFADFPGSLKSRIDAFKQQAGLASTETEPENNRTGHCFNQFEVQRLKVQFRSPFEHAKPLMHPQTAIVVGPAGEELYTDKLNRVKVRFHWDRLSKNNECASCWVRVSYPNAGQGWGAVHVPRIGQEVIVTFLDGDVDRPVITGRIYNAEQWPQWHTDGRLSGYRSKEYKGAGFNQLVMDDNTGQNRIHLYSSHTNAQLNLGYLLGQQGNQRNAFYGSGFALHSDAYGAITAHRGLYISTFARPGSQGSQLDVKEAHQQLTEAQSLAKALSDTASKAGAEALGAQEALKKFTDATQDKYEDYGQQSTNRFKEAVLLLASPAGIGLSTPTSTHIHSGENATLSSGADTNLAVGKSLVASVAERISLFAYNAGMKLFSAKGKVEIQAQGNDLDIIAEKVLRLMSASDRIEIAAKTEVLISAGGSFIRINESGITQGTSGMWTAHASMHSMPGPTTIARQMNTWKKTDFDEEFIARHQGSGKAMANRHFEITREDGSILRGMTDTDGKTGIQKSQLMGNINLKFLGATPR